MSFSPSLSASVNDFPISTMLEFFHSDPKFSPFLVLTCEEKCKVEFHEACWKNMKKEADGIDKPKVSTALLFHYIFIN